MARATTAGSGARSRAGGSSAGPSPPTGRRTGSVSSESSARKRALARTRSLFEYDRKLGSPLVAGADEAGRGCLAGPLVAAAVLFDHHGIGRAARRRLSGLDDSKRVVPQERIRLFDEILSASRRSCVVVVSPARIDSRGLHRCNLEALGSALERLLGPAGEALDGAAPVCLVDGRAPLDCPVEHRPLQGGDGRSAAVAAASVLAKVSRDRLMEGFAGRHPGWGFEGHVGYATPAHLAAIERLGPSPIHRLSFGCSAYPEEWPDGGALPASVPEPDSEGSGKMLVVDDGAFAVEGDADHVEAVLAASRG